MTAQNTVRGYSISDTLGDDMCVVVLYHPLNGSRALLPATTFHKSFCLATLPHLRFPYCVLYIRNTLVAATNTSLS